MKRYSQVGLGARAVLYYEAMASDYSDCAEIVGFCDLSPTRMAYANERLCKAGGKKVPCYLYTDFERMIRETKPDTVIVTSVDRTHHLYIIKAMEMGCDVITDKPLTIDAQKAKRILDTMRETGRDLRVTFNCRYMPHHAKVRELLMQGVIGDVFSVHFEWLLDTRHGADYFRRWHRNKLNSGGLLVHKATHHFDLINFWLDTKPETVFGFGALNFYGRHNAEKRGETVFYPRSYGSPHADGDYFSLNLNASEMYRRMYLEAEEDSGYLRDRSVFADDISIEDTMSVLVRYENGAQMSYSLNAYLPYEGLNVAFNGERGRMEYRVVESGFADGTVCGRFARPALSLRVFPMFEAPYDVSIHSGIGSHDGGDNAMLNDIFRSVGEDPLHRAADHIDGVLSMLVGAAANQSIASGMPVRIDDLLCLNGMQLKPRR